MKLSPEPESAGMALPLVLGALAIILIIVLTVADLSVHERRVSAVTRHTLTTELLAATVENLVQSHLRMATSLSDGETWASQPGMIRNFDASGSLTRACKLYSCADEQVEGKAFAASLAADIADAALSHADLPSRAALLADLNAPALFRDEVHYPVVDPRAAGKVEGFNAVVPMATYPAPGGSRTVPVLPMPVRWLYVLEDGSVVAPVAKEETGRVVEVPGAGRGNAIVGRIAYWTDDEAAKLNLNTAAGGVYWDTPRAGNRALALRASPPSDEVRFATFQPANREYQRYPGHPATTSLVPVLGSYLAAMDETLADPALLREKLLAMSPRYTPGGSLGGTVIPNAPLSPSNRPFFASVDEYFFNEQRAARDLGTPEALASTLEQTRFFLTAQSRSPEVNLFNLPRVSIWPVHATADLQHRTVNDNLNLFCATLGTGQRYAFTRSDPNATNGELSGRNQVLCDYLDALMKRPIPGFGPTRFSDKYGADQPQILTEIVDFIRSTNIADQSMANPTAFSPFTTRPAREKASGNLDHGKSRGTGQVVPMQRGDTRGFGRFAMISEAAIVVVGEKVNTTGYQARAALALELTSVAQGPAGIVPRFTIRVEGLDGIEIAPADGQPYAPIGFGADVRFSQYEMGGYSLFGGTMGLAGQRFFIPPPEIVSGPFGTQVTSGEGTKAFLDVREKTFSFRQTGPITVTFLTDPPDGGAPEVIQTYKFNFPAFTHHYPAPLRTPANNEVRGGADALWPESNAEVNSTLAMRGRLPSGSVMQNFSEIYPINDDMVKSLVPLGNIGSGNHPAQADLRLIAAMADIPADVFVPNQDYDSPTSHSHSHSLSHNFGAFGLSQKDGRYGKIYRDQDLGPDPATSTRAMTIGYSIYDLPPAINGVFNTGGYPGDFDTGISFFADGPWINKTDDGEVVNDVAAHAGTVAPYYFGSLFFATGSSLFSPNRQTASPVQFGSLPSGVKAGKPWQTLLFCPNPAAVTVEEDAFSSSVHPGFASPPDHLLLDLFWMPMVEPWAISDPLSTAGKVNLNQQIFPFVQIERTTALRGVLAEVKIPAIPYRKPLGGVFRFHKWGYPAKESNYRYPIHLDRTIDAIAARWKAYDAYRCASEICEVFLIPRAGEDHPVAIPENLDESNIITDFWQPNRLTGDNLRERPYSTIYPRLTTQSNVYTVHYTVQALQKARSSEPGEWDEDRDQVTGEQRGAVTIERYIDPRDSEFDLEAYDFAEKINATTPPTLGRFYRFRTISTRQFRY